ncbi:MAG: hypothetical protein SFX73_15565, partial [Kofleriaceae bacterium]|nr:hypothetical protein [Kofleriaceae bacterium]
MNTVSMPLVDRGDRYNRRQMRQHLANVILASTTLSGCSLLYDTNELPSIDAPIDAAIDMPPPVDA